MELHQERFEAWLFSQPKKRVIEAANGTKCFLCSFVKETTSFENAYFSGWYSWTHNGHPDSVKHIPAWAIKLIDPGWCNKFSQCCISAGEMQDRYRKLFPETTTAPHVCHPQLLAT